MLMKHVIPFEYKQIFTMNPPAAPNLFNLQLLFFFITESQEPTGKRGHSAGQKRRPLILRLGHPKSWGDRLRPNSARLPDGSNRRGLRRHREQRQHTAQSPEVAITTDESSPIGDANLTLEQMGIVE